MNAARTLRDDDGDDDVTKEKKLKLKQATSAVCASVKRILDSLQARFICR
jgi:hypothetical protein